MNYFKKAICSETFVRWDIKNILRYAKEIGYDGVEIDPYKLVDRIENANPDELLNIRKFAESIEIEIIGIHSIFKGTKEFFYINHPNASIRSKTVDHLKSLIEFCGYLGGKIMVLGASKQRIVFPELTYQQAWDYTLETFGKVLDVAKSNNVIMCLEPLSHRLTNFITKALEAVKMVEEINHQNFRMMIDVRSASDDEMPIPELIKKSAICLAHFHANDDNGKGPGTGNADYISIISSLNEIGYKGYLSVEVFDFQPDPKTIAEESIKALKILELRQQLQKSNNHRNSEGCSLKYNY